MGTSHGSGSSGSSRAAMAMAMMQWQWVAETCSIGSMAAAVMVAMAQCNGAARVGLRPCRLGLRPCDLGCDLVAWAAVVGTTTTMDSTASSWPVTRRQTQAKLAGGSISGSSFSGGSSSGGIGSGSCMELGWQHICCNDNSNVGRNNNDDDGFYHVVVPLPVTGGQTCRQQHQQQQLSSGIGSGSCMERGLCC